MSYELDAQHKFLELDVESPTLDTEKPITFALQHTLLSCNEDRYKEYANAVIAVAGSFQGYLNGRIIRTAEVGDTIVYILMIRFNNYNYMKEWASSKKRNELTERGKGIVLSEQPLAQGDDLMSVNSWFIPHVLNDQGPPKWKAWVVMLFAAWPILFLWAHSGIPDILLTIFPPMWHSLVNILSVFSIVSYVTDRLVMTLLNKWLNRPRVKYQNWIMQLIEEGTTIFQTADTSKENELVERIEALECQVRCLRKRQSNINKGSFAENEDAFDDLMKTIDHEGLRNDSHEVSVVIHHNVHWEYVDDYLDINRKLFLHMESCEGFIDHQVIAPPSNCNSTQYAVIFTFDNIDNMQKYMESELRKEMIVKLRKYIIGRGTAEIPPESSQSMVTLMLGCCSGSCSKNRPPPIWKAALTASVATWPFAFTFESWIFPLLVIKWKLLPLAAITIILAIEIIYVLYLVLPFLNYSIGHWLNEPRQVNGQPWKFLDLGCGVRGRVILLVIYIIFVFSVSFFINRHSLFWSIINSKKP